MFFVLGCVCNIPNGGISNFGTIIIKGFGFSTLVTTLMQIPYGALIAICILGCVFLNNKFENKRCLFILLFLCPNIAGTFGLRYVDHNNLGGRYVCYLLTGPYNAAFVLILSLQVANTAGHTKKVVTVSPHLLNFLSSHTEASLLTSPECRPIPRLLHRQHRRPLLLQNLPIPHLRPRHLEHDRLPPHRSMSDLDILVPHEERKREKG